MYGSKNWYISIAILAAFSLTGWAQRAIDRPTRSLLVNVFERNGKPVRDLSKDNFRVRLNGKQVTVVDVSYSVAPRRIAVLLDMSASMRGASERNKTWQIARDALQELLDQTPHDVPLALLTFSNQVHDVFDFSQDRSTLIAWLNQSTSQHPTSQGRTALRDAILAAVKLLQPIRLGDSIYVITDGDDTDSHVSSSETKRVLSESGVRLFAFLFATSIYPTDEETGGRGEFLGIARDSGGFVFGVRGGTAKGDAVYPSEAIESEYNKDTRNRIKLYTQALGGFVNGFYAVQVEALEFRKKMPK